MFDLMVPALGELVLPLSVYDVLYRVLWEKSKGFDSCICREVIFSNIQLVIAPLQLNN